MGQYSDRESAVKSGVTEWQDNYTYALQLVLRPEVSQAIENARQDFQESFHLSLNKKPCQITIADFHASESFLPTLLRWIQRLAASMHELPLQLNNFSGVPPHEIYLRVVDHEQHHPLHQQLQKISEAVSGFSDVKTEIRKQWRLPVVDQLPGMLFDKAMHYFSRQELFLDTMVEEICLVRNSSPQQPRKLIQSFTLAAAEKQTASWFAP
jgi:hypothetical protein